MTSPIITLLSDFGLKDPYVAEMKAVILSICPQARIVDVSHGIEKFNVRMGAFVLASAAPYFPKGTIHVAIVDPSVGTKRRALLIETDNGFFIGPDNGLLMLAAQKQGIRHVYTVRNKRFILSQVSRTFHGRDVFAPAAAYLTKGCKPSDFGPEIKDYIVPKFARSSRLKEKDLCGEVLYIDDFGNIITNVSKHDLKESRTTEGTKLKVKLEEEIVRLKFCSSYDEVSVKTGLALIGSHGFLEIAVNQGNASKRFRSKIGDSVIISFSK